MFSSLGNEDWTPASHAEVCLAFLRAEWDTWPQVTAWLDRGLIDLPDLDNTDHNALRRLILGMWREPLLQHLPGSTVWWRVRHLRESHLPQLYVIGSDDWCDPSDRNELTRVALRRGKQLLTDPTAWQPPILWGHLRDGPITILEGNNRLVNYCALGARPALAVECFVGLSPERCIWHLPDHRDYAAS